MAVVMIDSKENLNCYYSRRPPQHVPECPSGSSILFQVRLNRKAVDTLCRTAAVPMCREVLKSRRFQLAQARHVSMTARDPTKWCIYAPLVHLLMCSSLVRSPRPPLSRPETFCYHCCNRIEADQQAEQPVRVARRRKQDCNSVSVALP